ncbi:YybH family protein [Granulicella arctica]|uniref:YybH family protein n=1 Tax=Granulicella arctica TaxID=940613 RepID=UPI0021DFFAE9|nr:SgcJ/EcaC family oxidoreductase [Granulicella arctica]
MTEDPEVAKVRVVIELWAAASEAGDLQAQLGMMTDGVTFLTAGNPPMSRAGFVAGFARMMNSYRMKCNSDIREITVTGDLAVVWNHLTVEITPLEGGAPIKRSGQTLTVLRRSADGEWRIWRDANMMSGQPA